MYRNPLNIMNKNVKCVISRGQALKLNCCNRREKVKNALQSTLTFISSRADNNIPLRTFYHSLTVIGITRRQYFAEQYR